jgi:transposase-like protein
MTGRSALPNNSIDPLPLPGQRWVARRKAAVVEAVCAGRLSVEEACRRYELCRDEFNSWITAIEKHGVPGLRATRFQIYREPRSGPAAARTMSAIRPPIVTLAP